MTDNNNPIEWFIFYTTPRAEKIVLKTLVNLGYDAFLPLMKMSKVWSNRQKKIIENPMFPNYIFVNTYRSNIYDIVRLPKICYCIQHEKKPVTIANKTIDAIKIMLSTKSEISILQNIELGDEIEITNGPLSGYEGVLIEEKGKNKFGVLVDFFNTLVTIEMSKDAIRKK